jgi:hypothetical protein
LMLLPLFTFLLLSPAVFLIHRLLFWRLLLQLLVFAIYQHNWLFFLFFDYGFFGLGIIIVVVLVIVVYLLVLDLNAHILVEVFVFFHEVRDLAEHMWLNLEL